MQAIWQIKEKWWNSTKIVEDKTYTFRDFDIVASNQKNYIKRFLEFFLGQIVEGFKFPLAERSTLQDLLERGNCLIFGGNFSLGDRRLDSLICEAGYSSLLWPTWAYLFEIRKRGKTSIGKEKSPITVNSHLAVACVAACPTHLSKPCVKTLSEKVHATIPKGIVGGFWFTVFSDKFQRMAREAMDVC